MSSPNSPQSKNRSISMPGESVRPERGLSPEEHAQAVREANDVPTPVGQDNFNKFVEETRAQGISDSGVPEQIFMGTPVDERPIVTRQGMRENFKPEMGIGYVPDHVLKRFNVNPETHVARFVHMNNYGDIGEPFLDNWLGDNPNGTVCRDKDNKFYQMKGEILCTLPKAVQDSIDADFNQIAARFAQGRVDDGPDAPTDVRSEDLAMEEIKRRSEETREALQDFFQNSRTKGMEYEQVVGSGMFTEEQIRAQVDQARWSQVGNRSRGEDAGLARPGANAPDNALDRATEGLKAATRGRSSHALGAGFDAAGNVVRA